MRQLLLICAILGAVKVVSAQRIFLIGDAGEPKHPDPNLLLLQQKIEETATTEDVLIFLGDNLYPKGLPDKEHPEREAMEKKLVPQLEVMKNFPGKVYMIPGNHDWAQGRKYGYQQALNMERFVEAYLDGASVFLPEDACPGPVEIPLGKQATLLLINTQYYLHRWDKPDEEGPCAHKGTIESLEELKDLVSKNAGKHILIAAHHPLFTYGEHHGHFAFKDHMKPLPILGSIHPLYRRTIGSIQDNTHPKYKAIRKAIIEAMNEAEHVVFASGHEHSLQLIEKEGHHFIVSGSGSKTTYVKMGEGSRFAKSEQGFAILDFDADGAAKVAFWGINEGDLFESDLYHKKLEEITKNKAPLYFTDSSATIAASKKYGDGSKKNRWLGRNYRQVWNTPLEVEVISLKAEKGGLTPIKRGGGMQTKSLRLEAEDGRQYVLRSIEKNPENAIPVALRNTFAQQVVEDQISASHPYGAYIVPTLAEAAQIYHTNPKPVLIPKDPALGEFEQTFAGTLALYEERPNKEAAGDAHFGGGKDVEGTLDVLEKLQKDNDHTVDQNFVVRNRLFDMWIGDWDRHDDQWRWVEFAKEGKGNRYRPIPRDRDQAFYINEGIVPKIAARKWALPKIEGFDEEVDWAPGLSQNARFFDRTFMNEPDWQDWQEQIAHLQSQLTEEVIDRAIGTWPTEVAELTGQRIKRGLMGRRQNMPDYARELYLYLSKEVEVVGSDKHEYFVIEHLNEEELKVSMHKRKKDGEVKQLLYERVFLASETKEVRLYGRDGEDVFEIKGQGNAKIKVRIIGGTDKDKMVDNRPEGAKSKTWIYDRNKSTKVESSNRLKLRLSDDPAINYYDRKAFKYDILMPLASAGINQDDGISLGTGFSYTANGWRKAPFASQHTFNARGAFATGSFSLDYEGTFTDVAGKWDVNTTILWQEPFFVNNFFGLGNESVFDQGVSLSGDDDDPIDYYRVRMNRLEGDLNFVKNVGSLANFTLSSGYRSIEVEETEGRVLTTEEYPNATFLRHEYAKVGTSIEVDTRKNRAMPQSGITAYAGLQHFFALQDYSSSVTRLKTEWAFYLSAKLPARVVFANRVGWEHNFQSLNESEFFNTNILGGRSNLRGYRRTRFYGQSSFYHNFDIRLKLFSFRSYVFPGQFGLLAFHDIGRVWQQGETSDTWHTGKGFGIWISPVNRIVLNLNLAFGKEENLPSFQFGYFF